MNPDLKLTGLYLNQSNGIHTKSLHTENLRGLKVLFSALAEKIQIPGLYKSLAYLKAIHII